MIINLEAASCQFHLSLKTKRSFGSFDFSTVTRRLELLPITSKGIFFSITPQWNIIISEGVFLSIVYLENRPSSFLMLNSCTISKRVNHSY